MNAIETSVTEYVEENVGIHNIKNNTDIFETGLATSLFAIQLMSYIENNFSIEINIDDLDLDNFKTISHIVNFITKKQTEGLK